jgi:fido (protein-threonine AMPylation protein)
MASPGEKLAQSLEALHQLQSQGKDIYRSSDFTRTHQERLLANGFLQKVLQGWYIAARPDERVGESTSWFTSFWKFSAEYLNERFGADWCLSAEQSIQLHTGNWTVPKQLLVRSSGGSNKPKELLHGISIFDLRLSVPDKNDIVVLNGMQLMGLPAALISCSPGFYNDHAVEVRAALMMISGAFSELLGRLLDGGHSTVAGRLAGAFRNVGNDEFADAILESMRAAGYKVQESDPFAEKTKTALRLQEESPYVNRLRLLWADMRTDVIKNFPKPPAKKQPAKSYLKAIDEVFVTDAYNSLSIEGYQVSRELIEQVQKGNWNPDGNDQDRNLRNALAARGYWQAFQVVKKSIETILTNKNTGSAEVVRKDHHAWYRELFAPSVTAGILAAKDLAGYRSHPVYIRQSMHVPPNYEAVRRDLMPTLFALLAEETNPAVRAVLGHFVFVYIHPYMDGNGRIARFLMNTMLASGGYAWTVIPVEKRDQYMTVLEDASVNQNIKPFTRFLGSLINNV